ncbi:MAG: AI-2E family transporter [bacterium]|nr:AI-2E family transporter [bacterium]
MKLQNVAYSLIITALVVLLLIVAEPIIVPFVIAILIWFVVKKTRNLLDKIGFFRQYIPRWIKTLLASVFIFTVLFWAARILIYNIEILGESYDEYASNVEILAAEIRSLTGYDLKSEMAEFITSFEAGSYLEGIINSISGILGNMVMIIFYIIFILIEESLFERKLALIAADSDHPEGTKNTLAKIDKTMSRYIGLKSLIALCTATLGYVVFHFVGLEAPVFWAFLLFMFNFIPSVGPILASILPALFSLLQFGDFTGFLIIIIALTSISVLIGNFLEPRLMGNTLNISPLVAVLSLAVWGALWGITGMLLSVPITVALIIIFSQFPNTRSIAILLSEKGRV